jgi:hypothetical protein
MGKTVANGYGGQHQRLRKQWALLVAAGGVRCWRCGLPILPGMPWDLGHAASKAVYAGPEHQHCNRSAGARKAQALAKIKIIMVPKMIKREIVSRW